MTRKNKIPKDVYLAMVGANVKVLQQKKPGEIKYKNPVAKKRARTMRQQFLYHPIEQDEFTLKSDPNFKK